MVAWESLPVLLCLLTICVMGHSAARKLEVRLTQPKMTISRLFQSPIDGRQHRSRNSCRFSRGGGKSVRTSRSQLPHCCCRLATFFWTKSDSNHQIAFTLAFLPRDSDSTRVLSITIMFSGGAILFPEILINSYGNRASCVMTSFYSNPIMNIF